MNQPPDLTQTQSLRVLLRDLGGTLDRLARDPDRGSTSILVQVVKVKTFPTTAAVFYGITPVDLAGVEVEGGPATLTPRTVGTRVDFALNIGATVPTFGTFVLATQLGGYWIFDYG